MMIKPLTDEERRWLKRLEKVLKDQPARLWLVESGDSLYLVDRVAASGRSLDDGRVTDPAVFLAHVSNSIMKITAVAG